MNIVVVHAHPSPTSFNRALFDVTVAALTERGHDVDAFDLYADGFQPALTAEEREAYHGDIPVVDPLVATYSQAIDRAEAMVFVYPTWWSGLPAMMKGWLEKSMVAGVAFGFDEKSGKVKPRLQHVRRIAGVTTYGSAPWHVKLLNDNGRRTLLRALRVSTGLRTKTTWLGLYRMDTSTPEQRTAFLAKVEREFRSW